MQDINQIKQLLPAIKEAGEAIAMLSDFIAENPASDEAFFLLGNVYRKQENWEMALNNYRTAMDLNPDSPARYAYNMVMDILAFYNKDMFNQ
jgi:cytochrome c-type biogenesis protein CcmH/NrfG